MSGIFIPGLIMVIGLIMTSIAIAVLMIKSPLGGEPRAWRTRKALPFWAMLIAGLAIAVAAQHL